MNGSQMQLRPHYDRPDSLISEYVRSIEEGMKLVRSPFSDDEWNTYTKLNSAFCRTQEELDTLLMAINIVRNRTTMEQLIPFDDA